MGRYLAKGNKQDRKRTLVSSKNSKITVKLRGKKYILTLILLCFVFPRAGEIGSKMETAFLIFCL